MSLLIKGMEMPLHTERDGEKDTALHIALELVENLLEEPGSQKG